MARLRPEPVCPFCGKVNGKNIYRVVDNFYGDSFSHVEEIKHDCKTHIPKIDITQPPNE